MTESSIFEQREKTKQEGKLFISLSGREGSDLKRSNPNEYARLRASAQASGLIGPSGARQAGLHVSHYVDVQPPKTTQEIQARIRYSEAECRRYYNATTSGASDNLAALQRSN